MTSPYSGASPAGQTYPPPPTDFQQPSTQPNFAVPPESGATSGNASPDVEKGSVGELIGEVTRDLSTLMRQELELAKAELTAEAKKAGQGAGMFGAAGFAGYMVLLFLSLAGMWGLSNVMDTGWAGLVIAVVWAVIGGVAFAMGRTRFRQVHPRPERTVETLQQVPDALKPH